MESIESITVINCSSLRKYTIAHVFRSLGDVGEVEMEEERVYESVDDNLR